MLHQFGKYNKGLPEVKRPPYGTLVTFRAVRKIFDPIGGPQGKPIETFYDNEQLTGESMFLAEDKKTWLTVSMLDSYDEKLNLPTYNVDTLQLLNWDPRKRSGILRFHIGHDDRYDQLYDFLMLSSEVSNNQIPEERKQKVVRMLEYVDYEKEAQGKLDQQDLLYAAYSAVNGMDAARMRQFALLVGIPVGSRVDDEFVYSSQAIIKAAVREYQQKEPKRTLDIINDEKSPVKARIMQAIAEGIVKMSANGKAIVWADDGEGEIFKLTGAGIPVDYEAFVTSGGGDAHDKRIIALLGLDDEEESTEGSTSGSDTSTSTSTGKKTAGKKSTDTQ